MEKELFARMAQSINKNVNREDQDGDGDFGVGIQFGA